MTHEDIAAEYDKLADALAATADPSNNWDTEAALKFRVEAQRHRDTAIDIESMLVFRRDTAVYGIRSALAWERIAVALEKPASGKS